MIWKTQPTIEGINTIGKDSMGGYLGIEFTEVGDDYLVAKMPVDHRTVQPFRILHGGASVVLAETLGSIASVLCLSDMTKYQAVGVEINANHLSSAREGSTVFGTVRPIRIGRTMQVWTIDIRDERGKLICVSRLTVAVVERSI
ncbi:MAG: hotdog fold thioesterase [Saprospiraceae bacterium]|nr:hotdog fold thioesterase [Saprospiraceae bacterium]